MAKSNTKLSFVVFSLPFLLTLGNYYLHLLPFQSIAITALKYVLGTIVFLIPVGYYLSLIIFPNGKITLLERSTFAIILSLAIPPFVFNSLCISSSNCLDYKTSVIVPYYLLLCLILFFVALFFRKNPPVIENQNTDTGHTGIIAATIVIFSVIIYLISSYPYIISADATLYYSTATDVLQTGKFPVFRPHVFPPMSEDDPQLMTTQVVIWQLLSTISLKEIIRYAIPLLSALLLVPFYLLIKELLKNGTVASLAVLVLFSMPGFTLQLIKTRPQTIFFLFSVSFLFCLVKYFKAKSEEEHHWLVLPIIIALVGFEIHALAITFWPILVSSIIIKKWDWIKDNFKRIAIIIAAIALITLPFVKNYFSTDNIPQVFRALAKSFTGFNLFQSLFAAKTYLANFSFVVLLLFIILVYTVFKKRSINPIRKYVYLVPVLIHFFIFLFILEILPRIGYNFMPDRAFAHISISLAVLLSIPLLIILNKKNQLIDFCLGGLLIASYGLLIYLGLLPSHYTLSQKEVEAVQFLNKVDRTENVLVISQEANTPVFREFGDFQFVLGLSEEKESIFSGEDPQQPQLALDQVSHFSDSSAASLVELQTQLADLMKNGQLSETERNRLNTRLAHRKNLLAQAKADTGHGFDVYVFYSRIKDQSFLARKKDWRQENYLDIDLKKFEDTKYFENVFDNGDVVVYHVKNSLNR